MPPISRGFRRRHADDGEPGRLPPGQYLERGFPVLSAGPTPRVSLDTWTFTIDGEVDEPRTWTWEEFQALPSETITKDIHCVTKWSKFDTRWKGVRLRDLFELAGVRPEARHVLMHGEYGYTANVPLADALADTCMVAYEYGGEPLEPEHGYPARTLIPHLYFWKSVKWTRGIELLAEDHPGFWEQNGYHNYADPFLEQRYSDD